MGGAPKKIILSNQSSGRVSIHLLFGTQLRRSWPGWHEKVVVMGIEQGDFVELRGRPWLVEAINDAQPDLTTVKLSCIADDAQGEQIGWDLLDPKQVVFESHSRAGRADYLLKDKLGRTLCVLEAKRENLDPYDAKEQARG
jgi:hypothetical protein